jgi:hypothetical protein
VDVATAVVVKLGVGGGACVFSDQVAPLVLDVNGYLTT